MVFWLERGQNWTWINLIVPMNRMFFRIIIQMMHFQMATSVPDLFELIPAEMVELLQELEAPKLKNIFIWNEAEVEVALTEHYLLLRTCCASPAPTHYCKLTFSVKFEVIYQSVFTNESIGIPVALKIQSENYTQQITLIGSHPSVVEAWSLELEKKINQRNFHKLFKAKKKIGKGAFATVYLAERLRDHKLVAVKAFSKEKQYSTEKGRQSLQNEIKLMRKVNHCNIMKLEGVYETENSIYVILEYLEGQQLNELLKSGRQLQLHEIRSILRSILRALTHLCAHNIVHRDLKPENILFKKDNSGELAICDFGLATYAQQEKYLFVRCGTPGFVAPEIINIKDMTTKCDPISDVFSAGVIFHYLLFGSSIFQAKKYNEILAQNRQCELNFDKDIYSTIDPKAFDLLKKMLEKTSTMRISAENALKHPFFLAEMEIEFTFRELTNSTDCAPKLLPLTPTTFTTKRQKVRSIPTQSSRKEPRPFVFS